MDHIFKEHSKRKTVSLNGEWNFCIDKENVGEKEEWFKNFPGDHNYINVPACWNNQWGLHFYVGKAWYSKEFFCTNCYLEITFGAVTGFTEVYLDGERIGEHYGGWLAFSVGKIVEEGIHTLIVCVDNTPNDMNTFPLKEVDWRHFGGITRSVEFYEYSTPYIKNMKISYRLNDQMTAAILRAEILLFNPFDDEKEETVTFSLEDKTLKTEKVCFRGEKTVVFDGIEVEDIRLWDIGQGNLYEVRASLSEDDYCDKIGFRKIEAKNSNIYLNGKKVFLKGVNRHELHPDWCFAVPANISRRDKDIIQDLNCNFVRIAHYPHAHNFVDYLDREGICSWIEIPMWQFTEKSLSDPFVLERAKKLYKEMVEQYYNHPSIVIWGLHNEVETHTQAGYDFTKAASEYVRSMDHSRLLSYASDRFDRDISFEFVDVVSLNNYFGWYYGEQSDWSGFIKGLRTSLETRGCGDKPVIMSEFGVPALYGLSSFDKEKWTMEYQADYLKEVISLCIDENGVCGTAIWHMFDFQSNKDIAKARSFNNKGILNEYRKPKMAYYVVKALYQSIN